MGGGWWVGGGGWPLSFGFAFFPQACEGERGRSRRGSWIGDQGWRVDVTLFAWEWIPGGDGRMRSDETRDRAKGNKNKRSGSRTRQEQRLYLFIPPSCPPQSKLSGPNTVSPAAVNRRKWRLETRIWGYQKAKIASVVLGAFCCMARRKKTTRAMYSSSTGCICPARMSEVQLGLREVLPFGRLLLPLWRRSRTMEWQRTGGDVGEGWSARGRGDFFNCRARGIGFCLRGWGLLGETSRSAPEADS